MIRGFLFYIESCSISKYEVKMDYRLFTNAYSLSKLNSSIKILSKERYSRKN